MKISYNWIRELTGTLLPPRELSERLTMVGLAVESVQEVADDYVLDLDLTSNRPDCLSHLGVAREVAAFESGPVLLPEPVSPAQCGTRSPASVEIRDADLCPRYAARVIHGVHIGVSPAWLVKKLETIGQRAINNVADITNYVLHEQGQPLHAFDLAKVMGQEIIVRKARGGEKIRTLDRVERTLDEEMLVIADASQPIAVAGVMGGLDTEISDETCDVLIESAYFAASSVRRTARLLGLHTEASHRFERGIDPDGILRAQERAVGLICDIAGGEPAGAAIDSYPNPVKQKVVPLRLKRVNTLTGLHVSPTETYRILGSLGFISSKGDAPVSIKTHVSPQESSDERVDFKVPAWRVDIEIEEDLIEEVARGFGYEKITHDLPFSNIAGEYHPTEKKRRSLRECLQSVGYDEAVCFSFVDSSDDDAFDKLTEFSDAEDSPNHLVSLRNPVIEGAARMRSTLLPGLLNAVKLNFNHGSRSVRLFEIGRVFAANPRVGDLPIEKETLAVVGTGEAREEGRAGSERSIDFYDIKGTVESAIDFLHLGSVHFQPGEVQHLQPGQQACIYFCGRMIGSLGRLADSLDRHYKFRQPVYVAEFDLQTLFEEPEAPGLFKPLPRYPSIMRDLSFIVDRKVPFGDIVRAVTNQDIESVRSAKLVGTFEGPSIPRGNRSLTLRIEYRSDLQTLRDEEADEMNAMIVATLASQFGARLRA